MNPDYTLLDMYLNGALGLSGETGEVVDNIKKWHFHHKPLNKHSIAKELGDVMWYIAELATALNMNLDDIAQLNIEKLTTRYPNGFSYKDAEKHLDI